MKCLIVAICLIGVACAAEVSLHAVFQAKWNSFKAAHGKTYSRQEEAQRLGAFLSNSLTIEQHNERHAQGLESYALSHNEFSDMTLNEFKTKMTGLNHPGLQANANATVYEIPAGAPGIPASADWRQHLPEVKNQGGCGSCYAFASLAPLEAQIKRKYGRSVRLSEQEIVDCDKGNSGCNGGWMTGVYNYIKSRGGVSTETSYPYQGAVNACSPKSTKDGQITSFVNVNNEPAMTDAIARVGPVAIALQAGVRSFQFYTKGVYNDAACGSGNIDHGVTAVGYGVEGGVPYYLIRNSWGNGWGEGGHMKIARTVRHVANYGYYPVLA